MRNWLNCNIICNWLVTGAKETEQNRRSDMVGRVGLEPTTGRL
jgi:hypothetical protein